MVADNQVGLLLSERLPDLLGGLHVVFDASHDAAVLAAPHHLGPEVPDASVEANLRHGVVRFKKLPEGLLLVVADVDHLAGCLHRRHLGDDFDPGLRKTTINFRTGRS